MAKYRKRPVVIEAVQFKHDDPWPKGVIPWPDNRSHGLGFGYIDTLEGKMSVMDGDYIITGVKGEKYPCNEEIFHLTYERVED